MGDSISAGFDGHGVDAEDTWFADCVHPSAEGHAQLVALFALLLR